ncbi:MAG: hypothetical protein KAV87_14380 [Desulfobacteraceae bacterium]|nr:hypothetical protein [Desulfobacteraceae bacterium]
MSGKAISYGQIWDFAVPKAVDESQRWVLSAMQSPQKARQFQGAEPYEQTKVILYEEYMKAYITALTRTEWHRRKRN